MLFKDYINEVENDAAEWIDENRDYIDPHEDMVDALWTEDSVTGNGSGSYTFSTARAWDNIAGTGYSDCLLFDEEFISELEGIGLSIGEMLARGPESIDVTARCLALYRIDFETILDDVFGGEA